MSKPDEVGQLAVARFASQAYGMPTGWLVRDCELCGAVSTVDKPVQFIRVLPNPVGVNESLRAVVTILEAVTGDPKAACCDCHAAFLSLTLRAR